MSSTQISPEQAWVMIPDWLSLELEYAHGKHRLNNPQRRITEEGLTPNSPGYLDMISYFGRFTTFLCNSNGESRPLLNSSQQLGKFVGTARALNSFLFEHYRDLSVQEADDRVLEHLKLAQPPTELPINEIAEPSIRTLRMYWNRVFEPRLDRIDLAFSTGNRSEAIYQTETLLQAKCALFAAHISHYGLVAQPGLPSGEVRAWDRLSCAQ